MRHKSLQILSIGAITAMLLVGCSSSNSQTTDTTTTAAPTVAADASSSQQEEANDTKTYGQITKIDGTSITVELGTKKEMNKNGGQGGKPADGTAPSGQPEAPSGSDDANAPSGTGQPEMPSGDNAGTPPSGQPEAPTGSDDANKQKGQGKSFSMLDLTGETKTLTVNDSTTVTINSRGETSTGSLSDLQEGDTISFELSDDDTTVTAITLQSMGQKGNGQGGGKQGTDNASKATEAPTS